MLNTWAFGNVANEVAWNTLAQTGSVLDAVERGCNVCEEKKEPTVEIHNSKCIQKDQKYPTFNPKSEAPER